jgi:two-component system chemotaxis sensor kinase CheA
VVVRVKFNEQIELIKDFIEEAQEFLDEFEGLLLQLEQGVGDALDFALLNEILGQLHTFKGNSGMMGYSHLQKYAHRMEDLFKALQSGELEFDSGLAEFVMQCTSDIRSSVSQISTENTSDPSLEKEIENLEKFLAQKRTQGTGKQMVNVSLNKEQFNPFARKTDLLKVDFERMDQLLNLMGELVIQRTRLGQIDTQFKEVFGEKGVVMDLSNTLEQIGKVTTELHEAIMKVRMLPIKQVFMRFPRYVRDFARERGKEINLQFEGEETELDKTVIDEIGEPLMHLIRNGIDHGIEKPQEREVLGKPREGMIKLRAYQESSHIIITVEDDGRGIDEEKLRKRAEQARILRKDENESLDLTNLIFISGVSTADEVTEVSGRGVGMDVVKKSLARINGTIEVESKVNIGTRFTIKLPLTLAIISALMVEASGQQYAIPLTSVVESVRIRDEDIHLINNFEVTNIRGRLLPLSRLSNLFSLIHNENKKGNYVVIVQIGPREMGIMVDSLLGQQEIVIKALDEYISSSAGVAGATILGDGKVVLIVDVIELMEQVRHQGEQEEKSEVQHA